MRTIKNKGTERALLNQSVPKVLSCFMIERIACFDSFCQRSVHATVYYVYVHRFVCLKVTHFK